jgi:hypothetical protein
VARRLCDHQIRASTLTGGAPQIKPLDTTPHPGGSLMNDLLANTIKAHGGLERWNQLTLYFTPDGLLVRHDYDVEISGDATAAHYLSDYVDVQGIMMPISHRILPRTPDGQSLAEPLIVSIGLSEITFS